MNSIYRAALACLCLALLTDHASAFCGFYVGKADTELYNEASKVVLVRDGNRTVITMANDYQGDLIEFAMVIPVPTFIEREQIHIANKASIDHLDAYTAPRLVEYYDENPCMVYKNEVLEDASAVRAPGESGAGRRDRALGVTVEAQYSVGEYEILILSGEESAGLETWLRENGYRVPDGASEVLGSYIKQNMRFFVAKVNLEKQQNLGFSYLRPLSIAFESPKFMLPIRLGTVNAKGTQELFIFALTRNGRIETTNYRTVKLPTDVQIPLFVENEFGEFYRAMFDTQVRQDDMRAVYLEYAWDMSWCDPCAADPLSQEELRDLGVFWLTDADARGQARNAFVTRLHLRYDARHFPQDLQFQETGDRSNYQGRYIMRHPWTGEVDCEYGREYLRSLPSRYEQEAQTLAKLTGWDLNTIRQKMKENGQAPPTVPAAPEPKPWWQRIWE